MALSLLELVGRPSCNGYKTGRKVSCASSWEQWSRFISVPTSGLCTQVIPGSRPRCFSAEKGVGVLGSLALKAVQVGRGRELATVTNRHHISSGTKAENKVEGAVVGAFCHSVTSALLGFFFAMRMQPCITVFV